MVQKIECLCMKDKVLSLTHEQIGKNTHLTSFKQIEIMQIRPQALATKAKAWDNNTNSIEKEEIF